MSTTRFAQVPMRQVGPIAICGNEVNDCLKVPLATYETPVWASTQRGAKVSRLIQGITCTIIDERMSRSIVLQTISAQHALDTCQKITIEQLQTVTKTTSRFARCIDCHSQIVGNLLYLRLEFTTGDASGHNMVTKAAEAIMQYLLAQDSKLQYISLSANYCTDKKVSAVNGILGRGKSVVCEAVIPADVCQRTLHSTPEKLVELNIKKNLIGSSIAGSLRSANAHFANQLLAFYLATGQDAANIVEGSQGFVHSELRGDDLYFSITIPHLIVGTVGNGKHLDFVQANLQQLGCTDERTPGDNSRRLAIICAAAVWCIELSLLAALTNPGELMRAHTVIERKEKI